VDCVTRNPRGGPARGDALCEEGAEVVACPAVAIAGPADPAPVIDWLGRFIVAPFDDLILLTGEGVYRLRDLARSAGLEPPFLAELGQTPHDQPRPEAGSSAAGARAAAAIARRAADDGPNHRAAFGRRYAGPAGRRAALSGCDGQPAGRVYRRCRSRSQPGDALRVRRTTADEAITALIDQLATGAIDIIALP
jgi:uroporphyrinogen-III synthase